ncbi:probable serine/threonine-protein kinase pknB [Lentisphaera araneosa HTCC2155]|uniref:Probable serine/threonine-protein kinase pknB n=1 Tax=Lentisphaera araneosa HTCC2155 TaxID=313628 RepID=A6DFP7_9BACT|nr:serine/threonine-protein kinase [Lentisphaera araneosa]EDM29627.1 probable serine/threonine-protein kinase pknB [Lentisphaera araneosa HTCC2155]
MSDLEKSFQHLNSNFQQFYQVDKLEEIAHPDCPILDTLRSSQEHYTDEEFITAGGEKKIYRVRDLQGDRYLALARPVNTESEQDLESFLREARISSLLQHPNILSVHETGLDKDGLPFFTMDFMSGQTLASILKKLKNKDAQTLNNFPLSRLIDIFQKICSALSYAHSKAILHLDIKPANIQVGEHGEVLLCDWGLAQVMNEDKKQASSDYHASSSTPDPNILNDLTLIGESSGTPGYMSPEKLRNDELSPASDIYSLGSLLYTLLSYQEAFQGSIKEISEKTLAAHVSPPSLICDHRIPRGLEAICLKAMNLAPCDRYQKIAELEDDLKLYSSGFPTKAQNPNVIIYLKSWSKRHRKSLLLSSFFTALIFMLLYISFEQINSERIQALTEKKRAEENLRLYEKENEYSTIQAENFIETINNLYILNNYDEAPKRIKIIKKYLERDLSPKDRKLLLSYKAGLHFVLQQYDTCIQDLEKLDYAKSGKLLALHNLSSRYKIKLNQQGSLEIPDLENLTIQCPNHIIHMVYYSYFYHSKSWPRESEKNINLIKILLNRINLLPPITDKEIKLSQYTDKTFSLDLSHHDYIRLNMPIAVYNRGRNLLLIIPLGKLDLSYTKFNNMVELNTYSMHELHIAGIPKLHNMHLFNTGKIKKVYHTLDLSDEKLKKDHPKVTFIRVKNTVDQ